MSLAMTVSSWESIAKRAAIPVRMLTVKCPATIMVRSDERRALSRGGRDGEICRQSVNVERDCASFDECNDCRRGGRAYV